MERYGDEELEGVGVVEFGFWRGVGGLPEGEDGLNGGLGGQWGGWAQPEHLG
jgi:hypothetical protein